MAQVLLPGQPISSRRTLFQPITVAAAFSPLDPAGIMAWYRGDDLAGTDGDPIGTWADASGNSRDLSQATSSKRPTIQTVNGKRVLRFAVDDHLATAAFASPTAGVTVFAIVAPTGGAGSYRTIAQHSVVEGWAAPYARWAIRANPSNQWESWVEDATGGAGNYGTGGTSTLDTWRVLSLHYNQSDLTLRQDGSNLETKGRTGLLTSSNRPLMVGANTNEGDLWSGDVRELIVYDNGVSSGNLTSLDTYAAGEKP